MPAEIRKLQELAENQDMLPKLLPMPPSLLSVGCGPRPL